MEIMDTRGYGENQKDSTSRRMTMLESTIEKRQELMQFLSTNLSPDSMRWARDIIGRMNRLFGTDDADEYIKVKYFYDNALCFFTDYLTEVTPASILCTLYICALEVGVTELGDEIESNEEFCDGVDMSDWENVTIESIKEFDTRTTLLIIAGTYFEGDCEILGGGILTMQLIGHLSN